jgi:LysM repeat protein
MITPVPEATPTSLVLPTASPIRTVTPRATFTPKPATPAASPTPTVTPTPIIYTVQGGDTLLVIAAQFGVSSEAIQEANGIVDPRRLQVGQQLFIPEPETDPEEPPTPTPTPLPVAIQKLNFLGTGSDSLWVLGEVFNPGPDSVSEIQVEVALLDEIGQILAAQQGPTQLDVVLPGQTGAFALQFVSPPAQFAQYQSLILSGAPMSALTRYYFDLAPENVQGEVVGANLYRVSGQLHNTGPDDVEQMRIVVTGYDQQGLVAGVRLASTSASLLRAGAISPFEATLTMIGSPVVSYTVQAQGLRTE